jgi:hypothetical protein
VKTRSTKNRSRKRQTKARKRRIENARRKIADRARRVKQRNKHKAENDQRPMLSAAGIQYEIADRNTATSYGGIGLIHSLAQQCGLADAIDRNVELLQNHFPYHESDHVLNIAYNALADGTCLEDLKLKRADEAYLNALGAKRIPDATTAGDFCRRFESKSHIDSLHTAIDEARKKVWSQQPDEFFDCATVDMDGSIVGTTGECKDGMDMSYKGIWGYHPLLISLAETREPLRIVNRSGNRNSEDGAAFECDGVADYLQECGFRKIVFRGDTAFSQTKHLDRWDQRGITFYFGYKGFANLEEIAENLDDSAWTTLQRPDRYTVKTKRRTKPNRVKEQVVVDREYPNLVLQSEDVAEFDYRPTACGKSYRMIVLRKHIDEMKGQKLLLNKERFLFYITNDRSSTPEQVVFTCNDRCEQENLIEQLKNGPRALKAPVDNLFSNWAYMLMTSLAWSLKAWLALSLPETGRWKDRRREEKSQLLKMEFHTFVNTMIRIPCQIVRTGRRVVYRLLNGNKMQPVFWQLVDVLRL